MDLSTAVSAMSGAAASTAAPATGIAGSNANGAVACPVCTLYLREGISLQRHLDTHPKEQVIEALIRASSNGTGPTPVLASQICTPPSPPNITQPLPQAHQTPTQTPVSGAATQLPSASPSPHVPPHAQSPYPIGPIYECPPQINAMIPPPQFASFSYQQFVNNGTMMIPAQYAMAQAQAAPTSQMMQMLYNPYGMYHQQQIPTVQMISAPTPASMMPATSAALPQSASALPATSACSRPPVSAAASPAVATTAATTSVHETAISPSSSLQEQLPPRSPSCAPVAESAPRLEPMAVVEDEEEVEEDEMTAETKEQTPASSSAKSSTNPECILSSNLEVSDSPPVVEQQSGKAHAECAEQDTRNQHGHVVDRCQRKDSPTSTSDLDQSVADDDKTDRIRPDIEDVKYELESLVVQKTNLSESHRKDGDESMEVTNAEPVETAENVASRGRAEEEEEQQIDRGGEEVEEEATESKFLGSNRCTEVDERELENKTQDVQTVDGIAETRNLGADDVEMPELDHINRLLMGNMRSELSNIDLPSRESKDIEKPSVADEEHDAATLQSDEDETTNTSYHKAIGEPIECKIIVAHEESSDLSSVVSSSSSSHVSAKCDAEVQKITSSASAAETATEETAAAAVAPTLTYRYKYSHSAPTSPVNKPKKFFRSLSRASLRSDFDRSSNDNVCPYPVGFEATTLHDFLKEDNYKDEDMELEELDDDSSSTSSTSSSSTSGDEKRGKQPELEKDDSCQSEDDTEVESCQSEDEDEDEDEDDDEDDERAALEKNGVGIQRRAMAVRKTDAGKASVNSAVAVAKQKQQQQHQAADFRSQSLITDHYAPSQFPIGQQHQQQQHQQQSAPPAHHENYPFSSSGGASQNLLNLSECADPSTSTDSKSFNSSSTKSIVQKPSTELLNISEDAHAGPINVFEFDGLQILVPSTFISESSQKAVSGTSRQSMSSSENGVGNDEEVKSVNMRADETMPARGELSEQESNGCTEQSAWQLYMGQESSRMSTSYDLMARESWEESEGSEHEDNNGGPLLDSRSLATHFTSSLFLDRDRKTPTRHSFKCSHCPEVFDCPKERRVHSTLVHKEAGPSSISGDNVVDDQLKDIKLLEGRANVFEDIFAPGGLHAAQQVYQHQQQLQQQQQQQSPLLHQLQPPQHRPSCTKTEADSKIADAHLHLSAVSAEVICSMCNQRFSSEKSLQIHHRRMHMTEPAKRIRENAKCQICSEEFSSVASFNLHLKIHPLECGQCGKYFYRKQNFKLHMKRHLGIKPFPCSHCDKAFLTKQKLDEHTNGHTGNAPVKCNLCNETFRRYSNLTQHKNRHHLNVKKKLKDYICHCGEVFHTKKKLAWHKETHDEKPKACTYCNERFIHMASLTRHMRRAHNRRFVPDVQRENENVECPICKCIYLRSSLAVHMRVHNGERPYPCPVCSKTFSTKWNLQLHKWTHAARSTKPFKCNQCSAAFYRHSDYTAHMNSHRNVRPYTCNYCGAQFIRKYNCLRHVKEHEENKQYTCEICSKTFHRSYYLKEHLRVHSGQRPYTCHICGKSSSTKSNHNKHVRIHHAREPVNTEN